MLVRLGVSHVAVQKRNHVRVELTIVIEDDMPVRTRVGECFPELLQYPFRCWMSGSVEVQNLAPTVLDHEKQYNSRKCHRRHGKEVKGRDGLLMVREERTPAPGRVPRRGFFCSLQGDGAFRNLESEFRTSPCMRGAPQSGFSSAHSAD